ncbi:unnamed protein product [Nezara viridula]|uniref:Neuropeptide n=1 Tax=Nezara viridula TaxID=85310 RepID=A0A9P0MVJ4_NEZVI|nr:unnamed protein product [Nezara viridula]
MSLIWFLFSLVCTKAIVVVGKPRGMTLNNTVFEFQRENNSSYSIPARSNEDDFVKPVKTHPAVPLFFNESSRSQENVELVLKMKPRVPINSSGKRKRDRWIHTTPPKLFLKSVASKSFVKHGSFKSNVGSISRAEKKSFLPLMKNRTWSKLSRLGDTRHDHFVRKIMNKRSYGIPNSKTDSDRTLPSNLKKISNSYKDSQTTIANRQQTLINNLENPVRDEMSTHEHTSSFTKLYEKFQIFTSHSDQPISTNGTNVKKKNIQKQITTRNILEVITDSAQNGLMTFKYNISEAMRSKLNRSRYLFDSEIVPYYDSGKSVFVNPKISEIIANHPSKELDIKSLKKFKPLMADYEYTSLQNADEEHYEDFDWYQTDDLYEPLSNQTEFSKNNIVDEKSTVSTLSNMGYCTSQDIAPIKDSGDKDKQIMVLGVQHTPYPGYDNQFTTNTYPKLPTTENKYINMVTEQVTLPLPAEKLTPYNFESIEREIDQQLATDSVSDELLFTMIFPNTEQKLTSTEILNWRTWEKRINELNGLGLRQRNIKNEPDLTPAIDLISDEEAVWPRWQVLDPRDFTPWNELSHINLTEKTGPIKLNSSTIKNLRSDVSMNPELTTKSLYSLASSSTNSQLESPLTSHLPILRKLHILQRNTRLSVSRSPIPCSSINSSKTTPDFLIEKIFPGDYDIALDPELTTGTYSNSQASELTDSSIPESSTRDSLPSFLTNTTTPQSEFLLETSLPELRKLPEYRRIMISTVCRGSPPHSSISSLQTILPNEGTMSTTVSADLDCISLSNKQDTSPSDKFLFRSSTFSKLIHKDPFETNITSFNMESTNNLKLQKPFKSCNCFTTKSYLFSHAKDILEMSSTPLPFVIPKFRRYTIITGYTVPRIRAHRWTFQLFKTILPTKKIIHTTVLPVFTLKSRTEVERTSPSPELPTKKIIHTTVLPVFTQKSRTEVERTSPSPEFHTNTYSESTLPYITTESNTFSILEDISELNYTPLEIDPTSSSESEIELSTERGRESSTINSLSSEYWPKVSGGNIKVPHGQILIWETERLERGGYGIEITDLYTEDDVHQNISRAPKVGKIRPRSSTARPKVPSTLLIFINLMWIYCW